MNKSSNPVVVRKIQSVGITTLIEYYYLFKSQYKEKSNEIIFNEFRKNKEPWNDNSFNTKSSQGKSIFNHNLEKQALEFIIFESNIDKIGIEIHKQAIAIYNKEFR